MFVLPLLEATCRGVMPFCKERAQGTSGERGRGACGGTRSPLPRVSVLGV